MYTYRTPEHRVQTNDPMVMFTYVGPFWLQSKHCLLPLSETSSRKILRFLSSCFFRTTAIFLSKLLSHNKTHAHTHTLHFMIILLSFVFRIFFFGFCFVLFFFFLFGLLLSRSSSLLSSTVSLWNFAFYLTFLQV